MGFCRVGFFAALGFCRVRFLPCCVFALLGFCHIGFLPRKEKKRKSTTRKSKKDAFYRSGPEKPIILLFVGEKESAINSCIRSWDSDNILYYKHKNSRDVSAGATAATEVAPKF